MSYRAPLEDMNFLLNQVFKIEDSLGGVEAFTDFDSELYSAILEEAAKFSENVLFPINRSGDEEGCHFENGTVTTPKGFKEAYQEFCQSGWQGTNGDPEYGGQGLPKALHVLIEEMIYSSNTAFCLYPSLTNGAYHAIHAHASDELKQTYLPPMLEGRWAGAMGLTEPHAGSDLGIIKTKAENNNDGTYSISGTKIFITGGEHDLSENIIHLVLAKLPGAPEGPKGISLFLVPKIKVNADGSLGDTNGVTCGSIEHKMGIKASSTCVMNFDGAEGYLVGKENRGLFAMFTMMNLERLSIGIQGIGLGETSYQLSKAYASERKQGRNADGEFASIDQHADVRRMLLQQRVFNEAGRALAVFMGLQIDKQYHHADETQRRQSAGLMALLTPIAKAFFTDKGYEACNHGVQVLGGHGYVREWGLEQLVRDAKIAQIYEGTNGIQAQDFMVRKVCLDKDGLLDAVCELIEKEIEVSTSAESEALKQALQTALSQFKSTSEWLKANFSARSYELQGGAVDYLHAAGHLVYGWMWLKIVNSLSESAAPNFKARKLLAANYYRDQVLPNVARLCEKVECGYEAVMAADSELI
ncbi:acyl-CoA dehydrogenase [Aliikangiella coralliicola]|uniref:3-methylmercaptopropionyl-CoA dehydrogenase n=1 Tax=Aliikangiella coralliicola TaxID=2592383 RepID=A0A545U0H9_9GAMM|nr:acyl-CoA dehydrogenase [Aliikangiella coralliicola]TQV82969.1 acyl-CoA dehydrogenase [Aliikangiella coralliicola]